MEWIDGLPLYPWARQHPPSPTQVLRLLAQLARALQSVHSHGSLHRDVKGDNVLVRRSDERAFLIDFGSGLFPEAATLTPPDTYPGTPAYRSPESGLFELQFLRQRSARYRAGPADDIYALGVTACRLLTGEYPQFSDPFQDERGTWRMEAVQTPDSLLQVHTPLRELVLRMLLVRPEERGSVAQLAEDLEQAASAGTKKPTPVEPSREVAPAASSTPSVQPCPWWPRLAMAASALTLAVSAVWIGAAKWSEQAPSARVAATRTDDADGGTTGLGESAVTEPMPDTPEPSLQETMAEETLPEVLPEQLRPDANGHCPHKRQISLNGGCWLPLDPDACAAINNSGQVFKGRCYVPVPSHPRHRPSTSHPSPKP
jgi:serine/threonine protein kinase